MKRAAILLIPLILVASLHADEPNKETARAYITSRDFKSRVFKINNRGPRSIARSITLLGSGHEGAGVDVNDELGTITVRDFPENIATMEEAIRRLDVASPASPEIEIHLYVLVGSDNDESSEVPPELTDVVAQLRSTLRYSGYELMTSAIHRTQPGNGIEGSGVAEDGLVSYSAPQGNPVFYSYTLRRITGQPSGDRYSIDIQDFGFSMRVPVAIGDSTQYQSIGFSTPVTIREGEKVVVGTTTMGDKALIVVVMTKLIGAGK